MSYACKFTNGISSGDGSETNPYVMSSVTISPDSLPVSPNVDNQEFNATSSSPPAGWSVFNPGSSVYSEAQGWGGIIIPAQGTDNVRGVVRAIPGASTWTATFKLSMLGQVASSIYGGPVLRDSVGGRMAGIYHRPEPGSNSNPTIGVVEFTNLTSVSSVFSSNQMAWALGPFMWYRIVRHSATNFDWQISNNGVHFYDIVVGFNVNAFVTPNQIGFYINSNNNSQNYVACDYYRVT